MTESVTMFLDCTFNFVNSQHLFINVEKEEWQNIGLYCKSKIMNGTLHLMIYYKYGQYVQIQKYFLNNDYKDVNTKKKITLHISIRFFTFSVLQGIKGY